jgi:fermentation-respiration switch protein FrsA (DUF1100 family)
MKLSVFLFLSLSIFSCSTTMIAPVDINYQSIVSIDQIDQISTTELQGYWDNPIANTFIKSDIDVYKVVYRSRDANQQEKLLSGALLIPRIPLKGLISIQHATFFGDEEAPSENADFSVVSRKSIFSSNGYAVALPDYYGYGIDKDNIHPYHHAESLSIASKDMLIAAIEYLELNEIDYKDKVFLAGYSEGAYATAALQQNIESSMELSITASSIGAGAYNLSATVDRFTDLEVLPFDCLPCNAFLIQAYDDVYQLDQAMSYYFQEPYAGLISNGLLLGESSGFDVNNSFPLNPSELYNIQFIEEYKTGNTALRTALEENSIHEWIIKSPTLIAHSPDDNVVPYFNSTDLLSLNSNNATVSFQDLIGRNHYDGIFDWGLYTMAYFDNF